MPGPLLRPLIVGLLAVLPLAGCAAEETASSAAQGESRVRYVVPAPRDDDERAIVELLREEAQVGSFVRAIRETFVLPRPVTIRITRRDDEGPYYDPASREIVLPLSFVVDVYDAFSEADLHETDEDTLIAVGNVVDFVLLHELGHLLVDQLDLPVTGREEDAVDRLATVLAIELVEGGADLAVAGADFFGVLGDSRSEFAYEDFFDEHLLDEQRFGDISCLVYGSDPDGLARVARDAGIPPDRRARCAAEYAQARESWLTLLADHIRD